MELNTRIQALARLGEALGSMSEDEKTSLARKARIHNQWFSEENTLSALAAVTDWLREETLSKWWSAYKAETSEAKTVGIVTAGNIPLVGFHDMLTVLMSGHRAMVKLSSKDEILPKFVFSRLTEIEPRFAERINFPDKLKGFDAVIATGSNNTSRYFEYYFSKVPNIIRKNRNGLGILDGKESREELEAFGKDLFMYFGLGCRNVSKLFVPHNYDFIQLFDALEEYKKLSDHHKYANNYDYRKSILLVNREDHMDTGFALFKPDSKLASPTSVTHYELYDDPETVRTFIEENEQDIQCVTGSSAVWNNALPFGQAQYPSLTDYADSIDTAAFVSTL